MRGLSEEQARLAEEALRAAPEQRRRVPGRIVPFETFVKAIVNRSDCSPGPDGMLFKTRRKLGRFAAEALYDAFRALVCTGGVGLLGRTGVFSRDPDDAPPKKPSGSTPDGLSIFAASNMTILSIASADDRIARDAVRMR
eukprot:2932961-Pyramimonas_sp.AAC.1